MRGDRSFVQFFVFFFFFAMFGFHRFACMHSVECWDAGQMTPCVSLWSKQFQDDICSMREWDEGAEVVEEARRDVRFFSTTLAGNGVALDLIGVPARCWIRCLLPTGYEKQRGPAEHEQRVLQVSLLDNPGYKLCELLLHGQRRNGARRACDRCGRHTWSSNLVPPR